MKIFKRLQVSIDFSTRFLIISLALGALPPPSRTPTNAYFPHFLNFSINFRENFDKILKKISINFLTFSKNYKFFIDFCQKFLKNFEYEKR